MKYNNYIQHFWISSKEICIQELTELHQKNFRLLVTLTDIDHDLELNVLNNNVRNVMFIDKC